MTLRVKRDAVHRHTSHKRLPRVAWPLFQLALPLPQLLCSSHPWAPLSSLPLPYPPAQVPSPPIEEARLLIARVLKAGVRFQPLCLTLFALSLSGSLKGLQVLTQPGRGRNRAEVGGNRRGRYELVSLFLENECNFHSFPREAESSC